MKVKLRNGQIIHTKKHKEENGCITEEWICPICGQACWMYVDDWHLENHHLEDSWCEHVSAFVGKKVI